MICLVRISISRAESKASPNVQKNGLHKAVGWNIFSDFDSNNIKNITSSSVKVKAENLILDHNDIEVIEDWSFHDSQIANLSLKGNKRLRLISEDAFTGLKKPKNFVKYKREKTISVASRRNIHLPKWDVSQTAIRKLPTHGLSGLEVLKMKDTSAMWEIPLGSALSGNQGSVPHLSIPLLCIQVPSDTRPLGVQQTPVSQEGPPQTILCLHHSGRHFHSRGNYRTHNSEEVGFPSTLGRTQ
ncbi:g_PROTEIN_RECEP_F1_2 domain-containing protein [Caerostris extrusa]|uniref:G_PROTEIN_RECEP_F1_2 domain-containing protein n=1 Tax=Caerostris extrusa TaxID=172846 RepID=A0AAV4MVW7_CAEEX|nr:g_PROTEIN_RECEP_F1_2 domain-containing protein [Caerostris extrusa]